MNLLRKIVVNREPIVAITKYGPIKYRNTIISILFRMNSLTVCYIFFSISDSRAPVLMCVLVGMIRLLISLTIVPPKTEYDIILSTGCV